MTAEDFKKELAKYAVADRVDTFQRFFKSGPGEYGEGDQFIGVKVPDTRKVCKLFIDLPLGEIQKLLNSPIHEHRLGAAIILAGKYPKSSDALRQEIFDLYLKNAAENKINNWDIVDVTCEHVVGSHLLNRDRRMLYQLAQSENIWERRVAIISTFIYIKQADPSTTLRVADILLHDNHDLIQKAVGWMLREVGKRVDEKILTGFLDKHAHIMPRTMLRYSIERLPFDMRQYYLKKKLSSSA